MGYRNLSSCIRDLEKHGFLVRIPQPVDPHLEAAEIHRRVYRAGGPALLFENVIGTRFPMVSNLFGRSDRARFIFRDALDAVRYLVRLRTDPTEILMQPLKFPGLLRTLWSMRPCFRRSGPVLQQSVRLSEVPQLVCWPDDGGPFITLPAVYSEHPDRPGWMNSNLGMYRVQLAGNDYAPDTQIGLHYQIHRSISKHHAAAIAAGRPLRVNVFVGGPPSLPFSAVMPLPDGIPELSFAGAMSRHGLRMIRQPGAPAIAAEADFCISGTIHPDLMPEGPFGDHLGYYSLVHDFPAIDVDQVWCRKDAVWPFTVVGRPPQEDTVFGELIHEITGPAIPSVIPGISAVHAVDAAGVHPLLLAVGNERYLPYADTPQPMEVLTLANAVLGQGQLSLAKYLLIAAEQNHPKPDIHNIEAFLCHILERINPERDLHFQTCTTMDTLDYSGSGLNQGSKLVIAAAGPPLRTLGTELPSDLRMPDGYRNPRICFPGVLAVEAPRWSAAAHEICPHPERFCSAFSDSAVDGFPLIVLTEDSDFCAATLNNFLWVVFTRSDPAADVHGIGASLRQKHWGCRGSLVIDARTKPHMAPPLIEDPVVSARVDQLFAAGGPLHGLE